MLANPFNKMPKKRLNKSSMSHYFSLCWNRILLFSIRGAVSRQAAQTLPVPFVVFGGIGGVGHCSTATHIVRDQDNYTSEYQRVIIHQNTSDNTRFYILVIYVFLWFSYGFPIDIGDKPWMYHDLPETWPSLAARFHPPLVQIGAP